MKKFISIICLLAFFQAGSHAQFTEAAVEKNPAPAMNRSVLTESLSFSGNEQSLFNAGPGVDPQVYLKRKKTYLTVGLVLLGTGLVSSGVGLLLANDNDIDSDNGSTAATLFIVGAVTGIASIPFMSLSLAANNKYKAAIKSQPTAYGIPRNASKQVTGITISIPIGK